MGEYMVGLILGGVLGAMLMASFVAEDNMSYDGWEKQMEVIKETCARADSYPEEFNMETITCVNGAKFDYDFNI